MIYINILQSLGIINHNYLTYYYIHLFSKLIFIIQNQTRFTHFFYTISTHTLYNYYQFLTWYIFSINLKFFSNATTTKKNEKHNFSPHRAVGVWQKFPSHLIFPFKTPPIFIRKNRLFFSPNSLILCLFFLIEISSKFRLLILHNFPLF